MKGGNGDALCKCDAFVPFFAAVLGYLRRYDRKTRRKAPYKRLLRETKDRQTDGEDISADEESSTTAKTATIHNNHVASGSFQPGQAHLAAFLRQGEQQQ